MTRLSILLLLSLLAGVGSYLLTVHLQPAIEFSDYLPEDTLALVEWDDFARSWEVWQRNPAREKLGQGEPFKFFEQFDVPQNSLDYLREAITFLAAFTKRPSFHRLFSEKAVLALLPAAVEQSTVSPFLAKQLVLILQVENSLSPQQQLQDLFGYAQSQQAFIYKENPLVTFVFREGQSLSCWLHQGVLICAQDVSLVQQCIDQALKRRAQVRSGLQMNAAYQRLKQLSQDPTDVFFYTDLERLRLLPMFREGEPGNGGLLPRHLAVFHRARAEGERLGIIALANKDAGTAFIAQHRLATPVEEPVNMQISRETVFALWTNWFKLQKLWDLGLQYSNPDINAMMTSVTQQLSDITGQSLDAFFDVFGNGFGVFINEEMAPHQSNRSMGCLFIEVRDRPAVESMIKQVVAGLQVIKVTSGETEIASVMLAGGLLQPAYALTNDYLILADGVDLIEQAQQQIKQYLDNGKNQQLLVDQRGGNGFLFVRTGELIERMMPVLTLLAKETGERSRILPSESRQFFREFGLPLLTSLRGITTSHLRGYTAGDAFMLEVDYSLRRE